MTKVFLVNEPLKKDPATGEYAPFLPMGSARSFGEVVELTPKGSPGSNISASMEPIRKGLEAWRDGDFLVLVGDHALLAYAASVVGEKLRAGEALRLLKWERRLEAYAPLTLRDNRGGAVTNFRRELSRAANLRRELSRIADLEDSEIGEPLDEAIKIAKRALIDNTP